MSLEGDDLEEIRTRYGDYNSLTEFTTLILFALSTNEAFCFECFASSKIIPTAKANINNTGPNIDDHQDNVLIEEVATTYI